MAGVWYFIRTEVTGTRGVHAGSWPNQARVLTSGLGLGIQHGFEALVTGKVELDIAFLMLAVDQLEGVHAPALHVAPVLRDAVIIQ